MKQEDVVGAVPLKVWVLSIKMTHMHLWHSRNYRLFDFELSKLRFRAHI